MSHSHHGHSHGGDDGGGGHDHGCHDEHDHDHDRAGDGEQQSLYAQIDRECVFSLYSALPGRTGVHLAGEPLRSRTDSSTCRRRPTSGDNVVALNAESESMGRDVIKYVFSTRRICGLFVSNNYS